MKLKLTVDTDNIVDLLALGRLIDHYLSQPADAPCETCDPPTYGGIGRTSDYWRNRVDDIDNLERKGAEDSLMAIYSDHERKVMAKIEQGALDALIYGDSAKTPGGLADLVPPAEKKPPKDTELIDSAIKKRSLTDDWDRYR